MTWGISLLAGMMSTGDVFAEVRIMGSGDPQYQELQLSTAVQVVMEVGK